MPVHPAHPDPEELAAWQAGDLPEPSGASVEAHVAGCVDCAGMVAAVERGRAALAGLAEVEPPAGLHQRLAAAIEQEATMSAPVAAPVSLDGRRHQRRSPVGRRLVAALSAAAVVLLVVGLVPLLRHVGGQTATSSAGGGMAAPASSAAPAPLLFFSAPPGYSGRALQTALANNPAIRSAYQRAAGEASPPQRSAGTARAQPTTAPLESQSGSDAAKGPAAAAPPHSTESAGGSQAPPGLQQDACVASAQNQAGDQGLRPAFFVETVYRGRPATVLVTVRPGAPDQADLWAFPRDDCSIQPFAHERVTVQPP